MRVIPSPRRTRDELKMVSTRLGAAQQRGPSRPSRSRGPSHQPRLPTTTPLLRISNEFPQQGCFWGALLPKRPNGRPLGGRSLSEPIAPQQLTKVTRAGFEPATYGSKERPSFIPRVRPSTPKFVPALLLYSSCPGGHLKIPHPWPGQTPPPEEGGTRVRGCYAVDARFATRAAASFSRQLLPSNFSKCP